MGGINKLFFLLLLCLPLQTFAQNWQATSGEKHIALLEMFVSEGCGLCPAAEKYVNSLTKKGINEDQLIVLAFHIDYLNSRKGWVDKFASPVFTQRQKQLAHLNRYQHIFTPELVVSGETVHSWRKQLIDVIGFLNNYQSEVDINLQVSEKNKTLHINSQLQVAGEANRQHSKLYLAVTEDNIFSEVRGGDNAGRDFNHQNLVRAWLGPFDLAEDGTSQIQQTLKLAGDWQRDQLSVVAVVQNLSDGYVLQALTLPLKN
ncbi:MAG: DUF1223 domain-containing protein [Methylophaga sp.]|nr:DUF1223 domain-containing protein [Methylophaga sp.]